MPTEARHQARRFLAHTGRVDVLEEVDTAPAQQGFQALVLAGGQRHNQVRLTRLRDAKKAEGHRPRGGTLMVRRLVAHAVQVVAQIIGLTVQARRCRAGLLNPVQGAGRTGMNGCPTSRQGFLFRGQFVHECFTVPLSSQ